VDHKVRKLFFRYADKEMDYSVIPSENLLSKTYRKRSPCGGLFLSFSLGFLWRDCGLLSMAELYTCIFPERAQTRKKAIMEPCLTQWFFLTHRGFWEFLGWKPSRARTCPQLISNQFLFISLKLLTTLSQLEESGTSCEHRFICTEKAHMFFSNILLLFCISKRVTIAKHTISISQ